eukprot:CAMPEP_0119094208 /NCGR_PEP_ID=MMETSP1178-20130426/165553_1 /TAXON_ID=33656 /ORGANISM="unid sp, Strain CCMP2000" /LENGTH=267 /DNA_ID=CAMNT_0007077923 /DNA_START=27 /DNA_END=830 /DNA_ORIENTATION=+
MGRHRSVGLRSLPLWFSVLSRVLATSLMLVVLDALPRGLRQYFLPAGFRGKLFTGLQTMAAIWHTAACNLFPTLRAEEAVPPIPVLLEQHQETVLSCTGRQRVAVRSLAQEIVLCDLSYAGRPLVVALGSCTYPPFLSSLPSLVALSSRLADRADFAVVYVEEAHPSDGWRHDGVRHLVKRHTNLDERRLAASKLRTELLCCGADLKRLRLAVDLMGNAAALAFGALPARLALLLDGNLVWLSPRESTNVNALEARLEETLRQLWPV